MSNPTILVSPKGYDDVDSVLQRVGGDLANTFQLEEPDMGRLSDAIFLRGFPHLFLNCHPAFGSPEPATVSAIQEFVEDGGVLYASDWASTVVEFAFPGRVSFSKRVGSAAVVDATVSDPYLIERLGRRISITFDLDAWDRIDKFPASADVYLWNAARQPLAVGFRMGRGRVVFTSFHHHAQATGSQLTSEDALLQWLVSLPTQHTHLVTVGAVLGQHRAALGTRVVSLISDERQLIPVDIGSKRGLGVFSLSWDQDERLEYSMRYLRRRESPETEVRSTHPPLVMTVRDPRNEDAVEVRCQTFGVIGEPINTPRPYVFGASLRRDLLGDPDWFASAIVRQLMASLDGPPTLRIAREQLSIKSVQQTTIDILAGLGFSNILDQGADQIGKWTRISAWACGTHFDVPDCQIEIRVFGDVVSASANAVDRSIDLGELYPTPHDQHPGTEYLLVCLVFSRESAGPTHEIDGATDTHRSQPGFRTWRKASSESVMLGRGEEIVSADDFMEAHRIDVLVYRSEVSVGDDLA